MIPEGITAVILTEVVKQAPAIISGAAPVAAAWIGRTLYNRSKARQAKRDAEKKSDDKPKPPLGDIFHVVLLFGAVSLLSGCAMWDAAVISIGDSMAGGTNTNVNAENQTNQGDQHAED